MQAASELSLTAFVSGMVISIEDVADPVFSGRLMGDGIAIKPAEWVLRAPCDGRIGQLHASRHACVIEAANGAHVLLHIGLDTVLLKGEGFRAQVAAGDKIVAGQALIEFDPVVLAQHGKLSTIVLAVENSDEHPIAWRAPAGPIKTGDRLLTFGEASASSESAADEGDEYATGWARVAHGGGLHARPSALVATAVKPYKARVDIVFRGTRADARSATAVMALAVGEGDEVEVIVRGPGAADALEAAIIALETVSVSEQARAPAAPVPVAAAVELAPGQLAGVIASPGLAIGQVVHLMRTAFDIVEQGRSVDEERRALDDALSAVQNDIDAAWAEAEHNGQKEQAEIFAAHKVLAEDPDLHAQASGLIASGKSAGFAWRVVTEGRCTTLAASGNPLLAGRVVDLRDIERRVQTKLRGEAAAEPDVPADAVLLADDLLPSDFHRLARAGVRAIATAQGGPTSHVAILARAHGIPMLVAMGPALAEVGEGVTVLVDADRGIFDATPSPESLQAAQGRIESRARARTEALAETHAQAVTSDGHHIEIGANVANATDTVEAVKLGAESVGLLRTELLFLGRNTAPTEAEQHADYQAVLDALEGRSLIIRTLDVGADKSLPYVPMPDEENPALGLRGIRLCLAREPLLTAQLRGILALRPLSLVRIMLPMVAELTEIEQTRAVLDRLAAEEGLTERPQLGVMIETPAAAVLADQLATVADFFSVGTNDLTQYALCMDRVNPALAARLDGLHPAVLRLLAQTAQGAQRHGRWTGVCGAMASDPLAVPILIGVGVTELSVSPAVIPEIKTLVRRLSLAECQAAAREAMCQTSAPAVRALIKQTWPWLDAA